MNVCIMARVSDAVKGRAYRSVVRQEAARRTRAAVIEAARRQIIEKGYAATTVGAIAEEAGVAIDTVYAAVGPKPVLMRLLLETAISGTDEAQPALERDYVRRVQAARTAIEKLTVYAAAMRSIQARLAPLFVALREASSAEPALAGLWRGISERRAANMRMFAADLASTGELRPDLSLDEVADIIWTMNAAEYYVLLVDQRGWAPERFETWLVDAWTRLLLQPDRLTSSDAGAGDS